MSMIVTMLLWQARLKGLISDPEFWIVMIVGASLVVLLIWWLSTGARARQKSREKGKIRE